MSPRAACRLEALGFTRVYDYVLGIADWKAAGLPLEGTAAQEQRVADATRPDVPTCRPDEAIEEVRSRITKVGWDMCVVVDCDGIVSGRLRQPELAGDDRVTVEQVMEPGPATVRPHSLLQPLIDRMDRRDAAHVLVTTPQGMLIGVLLRDEGKRLLAGESPQQIWRDCEGCPGQWVSAPEARRGCRVR